MGRVGANKIKIIMKNYRWYLRLYKKNINNKKIWLFQTSISGLTEEYKNISEEISKETIKILNKKIYYLDLNCILKEASSKISFCQVLSLTYNKNFFFLFFPSGFKNNFLMRFGEVLSLKYLKIFLVSF